MKSLCTLQIHVLFTFGDIFPVSRYYVPCFRCRASTQTRNQHSILQHIIISFTRVEKYSQRNLEAPFGRNIDPELFKYVYTN